MLEIITLRTNPTINGPHWTWCKTNRCSEKIMANPNRSAPTKMLINQLNERIEKNNKVRGKGVLKIFLKKCFSLQSETVKLKLYWEFRITLMPIAEARINWSLAKPSEVLLKAIQQTIVTEVKIIPKTILIGSVK